MHVTVVLNPATLGGAWTDSGGNSGTFLFSPTAPVTGAPRPAGGGLAGVAVTNVVAGAGLTGGGMGPVNLAVAFAGSGAAKTAARSDHTHAKGADGTAVGRRCVTERRRRGTSNTAVGSSGALRTVVFGENNTALGYSGAPFHELSSKRQHRGWRSYSWNSLAGSENTAVGTEALNARPVTHTTPRSDTRRCPEHDWRHAISRRRQRVN